MPRQPDPCRSTSPNSSGVDSDHHKNDVRGLLLPLRRDPELLVSAFIAFPLTRSSVLPHRQLEHVGIYQTRYGRVAEKLGPEVTPGSRPTGNVRARGSYELVIYSAAKAWSASCRSRDLVLKFQGQCGYNRRLCRG